MKSRDAASHASLATTATAATCCCCCSDTGIAGSNQARCYSVVPSDFFNPNFSLVNPELFEKYLGVAASLAQQSKVRGDA